MKSYCDISTQEAIKYLESGWILKYYKDNDCGHLVYIYDISRPGAAGSAKYLSHGVFKNLVKMGYSAIDHKIEIEKGVK